MNWLFLLLGAFKSDDEAEVARHTAAERYLGRRLMHPGRGSTLAKAARAQAIVDGLREAPKRRKPTIEATIMQRAMGTPQSRTSARPRIVGELVLVTLTNERTGRKRQELHMRRVDRSRYPPDKLRELRKEGRR